MNKEQPKEQKLVSTRDYKYDRAMQEAAKRAQYQPKMISVNSKVKEFQK